MFHDLCLLFLLFLGVIGDNRLVSVSAAGLLLIRLLGIHWVLPYLEGPGFRAGLTLLIFAILTPFAAGELTSRDLVGAFITPQGTAAILGGIAGAYLGAKGLSLLKTHPESITGLVIGTIIGATFFDGIPVGPLVAAGMAALLTELFSR
ncbi:MAG TPA: DUF441 domain-containing protein [Firmicutes bacterium]|nr:DUF441 domain-containing protein [Bacillota bacterium]